MVSPCLPLLASEKIACKEGDEVFRELVDVPGTKLKRGVAQGVLEGTAEEVWAVITDYAHYKEFMPNVIYSTEMERKDSGVRYECKMDMPFWIDNVEYIAKVDFSGDRRSLDFKMEKGKGVRQFEGSWKFEECVGDKPRTRATYTLFLEPGKSYPDWIIRMGTKMTLGKVIKAVKKRLKSQRAGSL